MIMMNSFCKVSDFKNNNCGDFYVSKRQQKTQYSWYFMDEFQMIIVMIIHKDAETMCYRSSYSPEKVPVYMQCECPQYLSEKYK